MLSRFGSVSFDSWQQTIVANEARKAEMGQQSCRTDNGIVFESFREVQHEIRQARWTSQAVRSDIYCRIKLS